MVSGIRFITFALSRDGSGTKIGRNTGARSRLLSTLNAATFITTALENGA